MRSSVKEKIHYPIFNAYNMLKCIHIRKKTCTHSNAYNMLKYVCIYIQTPLPHFNCLLYGYVTIHVYIKINKYIYTYKNLYHICNVNNIHVYNYIYIHIRTYVYVHTAYTCMYIIYIEGKSELLTL